MQQRWRWPPETSCGRRPAASVQAEFLQHVVDAPVPFQARPALGRERQVLAQRHMRKQRVVLKHIAAIAFLRRQVHAGRGVVQDVVVQQDAAFIGLHESGDGIEHQRLARAAGAEEHRHAGGGREFQIQREARGIGSGSEGFAEPGLQHGDLKPGWGSGDSPASTRPRPPPKPPAPKFAPPRRCRIRPRRRWPPPRSACGPECCPPPST